MPVLTLENGKQYSQSVAIARYFAEKFDLTGKTDEERLHANMVVEVLRTDLLPMITKFILARDEDKQAARREAQEKIDGLLKKLNDQFVDGADAFLGQYHLLQEIFRS